MTLEEFKKDPKNEYKLKFGMDWRQVYVEKCRCGSILELITQADEDPEYYTNVFVLCSKCKEYVHFKLPVN